MMLQPYLANVELEGELSVIVIDGEPTHAVQKIPVPGDYRVQDDYGASDKLVPLADDLRELAAVTLATTEVILGTRLLYARVDALRMPDSGLVLNELEIVEPSLFFRHGRHAATRLSDALLARVMDRGCRTSR
jgi:glutathione synthase/RimK-type ligase-like ATP-grasp enzyme